MNYIDMTLLCEACESTDCGGPNCELKQDCKEPQTAVTPSASRLDAII